jgi:hypothetical protein
MIHEFEQTKAEAGESRSRDPLLRSTDLLAGRRQTDKLGTAHDLLFHDDKLTYEERKELWNLLQYVMSSPKTDLALAKSKLIAIKIQNAAPIKDFVTDFLAKYAAEIPRKL